MEVDQLKREDLEKLLKSPALELHDIIKVAKEEFDVDIVIDDSLSKAKQLDNIVDQVFAAYNTAIIEVQENKFREKVVKKTRTRKTKSADGKISAKQYIINLVAEGTHTKTEILEIMDEEYGYKKRGKSSKTRVSKTIRELKSTGSLDEAADGILSLKKN